MNSPRAQETSPRLRRSRRGASKARRSAKRQCGEALRLLPKQILDQAAWVESNGGRHIQKLKHIQPAVTAFVFRHIRRGLAQAFRNDRLREARRLAPSDQQRAKLFVALSVDGLWQFGA